MCLIYFIRLQLSKDLGFKIVANQQLNFSKCLEMKLQDHIGVIAKVAEVAGKEYSIEQVMLMFIFKQRKIDVSSILHYEERYEDVTFRLSSQFI